ncbi:unnamed protein product [Agarophyton chilense]
MANVRFDRAFPEERYLRAIQEDFTVRAPRYNSGRSGEQHRQVIQTLLEYYPPRYPLLDVACGTALLSELLGRKGEGVTGLDLTDAMLQQARIANPNATFVQGRAEQLPFEDCSFSSAYSCSALVYFTDIPAVVNQIFRVLKRGAFFAYQAVTLNSYVSGVELERAIQHLMNQAGFVDVDTHMIVVRDSLDVAQLERFWDATVGRNALMAKLRTLPSNEIQAIRDRWVQVMESKKNAEGVVPDVIESWYVRGWKP